MTKAKKKPAKKAKPISTATLERRISLLGSRLEAAMELLDAHSQQLDKHQRTLESMNAAAESAKPASVTGYAGFSGPQ